jgi:two-component system KDP operon response regulator KdpE
MSGARVLVVDDEPQLLRSLRAILTAHGYEVVTAVTGEAAVAEASARPPDVMLLDLMLPGIDGLEVCRRLRERSSLPIIVLSAQGEEATKVAALDLGADDYLTKPFGAAELLARLRVALRHATGTRTAPVFELDGLRVDFEQRRVTLDDHEVSLTPKEYDVLKYLVSNVGRVLTHAMILRAVWGPEYAAETQYLRNVVLALRRKLETGPDPPRFILTEPGVGYRLRA